MHHKEKCNYRATINMLANSPTSSSRCSPHWMTDCSCSAACEGLQHSSSTAPQQQHSPTAALASDHTAPEHSALCRRTTARSMPEAVQFSEQHRKVRAAPSSLFPGLPALLFPEPHDGNLWLWSLHVSFTRRGNLLQ